MWLIALGISKLLGQSTRLPSGQDIYVFLFLRFAGHAVDILYSSQNRLMRIRMSGLSHGKRKPITSI